MEGKDFHDVAISINPRGGNGMKKCILVISVVSCIVFGVNSSDAEIYVYGNGGGGGEAKAPSIGGEFGVIWPKGDQKYLAGMGFSYADTEKSEPGTFLLDKVRANEVEIYGAAGLNLTKGFFITGTAGVTETCEGYVFKGESPSNCTSMDGVDKKNKFTGSGQLRFINNRLMLGIGYHNRRGVVGGIGLNF
jgi:hypothetical protein